MGRIVAWKGARVLIVPCGAMLLIDTEHLKCGECGSCCNAEWSTSAGIIDQWQSELVYLEELYIMETAKNRISLVFVLQLFRELFEAFKDARGLIPFRQEQAALLIFPLVHHSSRLKRERDLGAAPTTGNLLPQWNQ